MFNFCMGLKELPSGVDVITRKAVRCIAFDMEGNLLMIHTKKGDYKFPGGGMNSSETLQQTLKREIAEETGFALLKVHNVVGRVEERNIDKFDNSKVFIMHSEYVECEVDSTVQMAPKLDEYEKELDFKVEFISIKDAIKNNVTLLEQSDDINPWVNRETEVLKYLLIIKNK